MTCSHEFMLSESTKLYIVKEYDTTLIKFMNENIVFLDLDELNILLRYIIKHKINYTCRLMRKYFLLFKNNFNYPFMRCKKVRDQENFENKLKLSVESKKAGKQTIILTADELSIILESHEEIIKSYLDLSKVCEKCHHI